MNWLSAPIKDVARVVTGNTPPKKDNSNYGKTIPWVKLPELGTTEPITHTAEMLSEKGASIARVLPKGTVLVSCIGSIGRVGIAGTELATNQQINAVVCGPLLNPRFTMYWFMRSAADLSALANKAIVPILNKGNFEKMEIPVWPIAEQHRIVELLDEADRLRKLRREADAKAARILPALFLKMFGDPATNPMGWDEQPLRSVIASVEAGWSSVSEARQRRNDEFGVLKVSAVTGGRFLPEEHKAVPEMPESRALVTPRRGDLLFSRANTRALVAASCIVEKDEPKLFLSDKLWRITPKDTVASTLYLKELFWKDGVRDQFRASSSGSSGSMLNISQDAVLRTVVPVPPYLLQQKFERSAWETMALKQTTREAGDQLDAIWQVLLTRAFSGQLTAQWRKAHMKELLVEMEQLAHLLSLPLPNELEVQT